MKVIYAFQLLSGTEVNDGWDGVHFLRGRIWRELGGILQADLEGFSNEDGYHILWQFPLALSLALDPRAALVALAICPQLVAEGFTRAAHRVTVFSRTAIHAPGGWASD